MTSTVLAVHLFLELGLILAACRVVGYGARRMGQPQVVGEIIAGIVLGPSLFGALLPGLQSFAFPKSTLPAIYLFGQIGLALYMFLVGMEFRTDLAGRYAGRAASIASAGIVVPFALGMGLGYALYGNHQLFSNRGPLGAIVIFTAAALSITAFPTMARMIQELGLTSTRLGTICLTAGCADDALAWCAFAAVLASFAGTPARVIVTAVGLVAYLVAMVGVARPALRRVESIVKRRRGVAPWLLVLMLAILAAASWLTDSLGAHAIFGAFILGAVMPRGVLSTELRRILGPVTVTILLPMFFVYSGLNTRIGLLADGDLLVLTAVIIALAILGKGVACWGAARMSGVDRGDAVVVGALMNARGLVELILLNIALARGIITPTLFTMFVIMALVTTLIASPVARLALRGSVSVTIDATSEAMAPTP